MNPLLKTLFDLLANLTTPLRGSRTHIGAIGAACVLVYAVMQGDYTLAATAFSLLMSIIGLKPEDFPIQSQATEQPDVLPMNRA